MEKMEEERDAMPKEVIIRSLVMLAPSLRLKAALMAKCRPGYWPFTASYPWVSEYPQE